MLIGSLVELHVGLHLCLCFSHLEKLILKAISTPPRYLAICRASSAFSYRNPDSFSTPGGSIENASASSIASRYLVDRSRFLLPPRQLLDSWVDWFKFCSCVFGLFLDTFSTLASVDVLFSRHLSRHLSIHRDSLACISFFFVLHFFPLCPWHLVFLFLVGLWFLALLIPLCQFSVCLRHVFWLFIPFNNHVKKGEKFGNWMSFLKGSNRLRERTSC